MHSFYSLICKNVAEVHLTDTHPIHVLHFTLLSSFASDQFHVMCVKLHACSNTQSVLLPAVYIQLIKQDVLVIYFKQ